MMYRFAPALGAIGLLMLAGCGGSSHSSSTRVPVPATTPAITATTAKPKHPTAHGQTVAVAKPHSVSSGPPTAPGGLRATTGFGMYELCSGSCSGSIPASLRRTVRTPASCAPRSSGPVTPQPSTALHVTSFIGSAWDGGRVTWNVSGYRGAILIRGGQIGGSGALGFGEGHTPYDELQLQTGSGGPPWMSFTRVKSPGCYFYQVDGTSFSETIVFKAM